MKRVPSHQSSWWNFHEFSSLTCQILLKYQTQVASVTCKVNIKLNGAATLISHERSRRVSLYLNKEMIAQNASPILHSALLNEGNNH